MRPNEVTSGYKLSSLHQNNSHSHNTRSSILCSFANVLYDKTTNHHWFDTVLPAMWQTGRCTMTNQQLTAIGGGSI